MFHQCVDIIARYQMAHAAAFDGQVCHRLINFIGWLIVVCDPHFDAHKLRISLDAGIGFFLK